MDPDGALRSPALQPAQRESVTGVRDADPRQHAICQQHLPYAINPTSAFLLNKFIPHPTQRRNRLQFLKASSTGGDTDEYIARVDQTINSQNTVFGRFAYWKLLSLAQDPFGTGLCKDRCAENTRSKSFAIGYNYAISPTTIAERQCQHQPLPLPARSDQFRTST